MTRSGIYTSSESTLSKKYSRMFDEAIKEFESMSLDDDIPEPLRHVLQKFLPGMCVNIIESPETVAYKLLEADRARFANLFRTLTSDRSDRGENSTHVMPIAMAFPTPFFGLDTTDDTRYYNLVQVGGLC